MSIPRYERYKECEIQWLTAMPEHWNLSALKRGFQITGGSTPGPDEQNWGDEIVWVTPSDLGKLEGRYISNSERRITSIGLNSCSSSIVPEKSIILSTRAPIGSIGIARVPLCTNQGCKALIPRNTNLSEYYAYLLEAITNELQIRGKGTTFLELSTDALGAVGVPVPPPMEQKLIAAFLDNETAKIDALIEEQRRLISLLMEKRQAAISHAVTKGLNPSAHMKSSGVTWIGDIPAHWDTVSSRRLFRVRNEPARESDQQLTASQKYGMVFQSDYMELEGRRVVEVIQGTDSLRHAEPNDFIISLRSFQGGLEWCKFAGSVTFHYVILAPIKEVHEPYFAYLFKSTSYIQALRATANLIRDGQDLRYSHFVLVDLPRVPIDEQVQIASYLDSETARIDALVAEVQIAIERLMERRSALISAAVTGKINVTTQVAKPVRSTWSTGFARQVIAAEVLSRCNGPNMGRIKLQKLIHLCEYHAQLDELGSIYSRKAAGPFDAQAMAGVREGLSRQHWFQEYKDGERYAYRPLEKAGGHKQYLPHWEDKQARIDLVLNLLKDARTRTCEIASTLYAAWNDLLIEGKRPTDAEIIHEASSAERWHESKEKIAADKWPKALEWMRAKGLVPVGYGTHTMHQPDLFKRERHEPA